jgi:hypothetical protein
MNQASTGNLNSVSKVSFFSRLEQRVIDLKVRRKRMVKIVYKKEGRLSDFEHGFKTLIARKS